MAILYIIAVIGLVVVMLASTGRPEASPSTATDFLRDAEGGRTSQVVVTETHRVFWTTGGDRYVASVPEPLWPRVQQIPSVTETTSRTWLANAAGALLLVVVFMTLALPLLLVPDVVMDTNRSWVARTAWAVLLLVAPVVGVPAHLFRSHRLTRAFGLLGAMALVVATIAAVRWSGTTSGIAMLERAATLGS